MGAFRALDLLSGYGTSELPPHYRSPVAAVKTLFLPGSAGFGPGQGFGAVTAQTSRVGGRRGTAAPLPVASSTWSSISSTVFAPSPKAWRFQPAPARRSMAITTANPSVCDHWLPRAGTLPMPVISRAVKRHASRARSIQARSPSGITHASRGGADGGRTACGVVAQAAAATMTTRTRGLILRAIYPRRQVRGMPGVWGNLSGMDLPFLSGLR